MWNAPALTVAAQAFLLIVLTDASVDALARVAILVAGLVATMASGFSLLRLRAREVQYSEVVAYYFIEQGLPDPRALKAPPSTRLSPSRLDAKLQAFGRKLGGVYAWWVFALVLFAIADGLALWQTWDAPASPGWPPPPQG